MLRSTTETNKTPTRNDHGSLSALLLCGVMLCIIGIGAFGMDVSHNISARTELQSATDAGALAGAKDLLTAATQNNADGTALNMTAANIADGAPVSNTTAGCTVNSISAWDNNKNSGTCTVDGTKRINNIFAKLFLHNSDTVGTHSVAQCWRSITGIEPNNAFPLMVSLDTVNGAADGKSLSQKTVGDTFTIWINSQQYKNGAWTGLTNHNTNANWLHNAIDQALGFQPVIPGYVPGFNVGDNLSIGNGVMGEKDLADPTYETRLCDPKETFILPVMMGEPPYNQDTKCVGLIAVQFLDVSVNQKGGKVESLTVKIVKDVTKGTGGIISSTGNGTLNSAMQNISAGTVKLVQ